jgi:hypothetical protein
MNMSSGLPQTFPVITAVRWLPAKEVLGGEATDFTPWLQQPSSLAILGVALKLEELTAVAAEHNVLGKRLDILATALDENGEEVPVCIENQYGMSDADHLGRLIAYLAQHERGRAVWVVERAHDAFVAAVRFLNRTSSDDVGYYLVQVRFTHGDSGGYQVHFEVLAAPIAWEKGGKKVGVSKKGVNVSKKVYLDSLHGRIRDGLLDAGFSSSNPMLAVPISGVGGHQISGSALSARDSTSAPTRRAWLWPSLLTPSIPRTRIRPPSTSFENGMATP